MLDIIESVLILVFVFIAVYLVYLANEINKILIRPDHELSSYRLEIDRRLNLLEQDNSRLYKCINVIEDRITKECNELIEKKYIDLVNLFVKIKK